MATGLTNPTRCQMGPDGRLYVVELNGRLRMFTLGRDHKPTQTQVVNTLNTDPNGTVWTCLGMAFDPLDAPDSVRVYIVRTLIYQPASTGAYVGRVTKLTGPLFDKPVEIITGLPVARFDHATNGIFFGDDGELYIQQGGNTNAGIPGDGLNGNRDEGPLSSATLIAYVRRPGFDGRITYDNPEPGLAKQISGFDVEVFAPGMRNPFGIVQHSNGNLYGTDNGPNSYFNNGTMWRCDSTGPAIDNPDKIDLIERGNYYGHPNRNRSVLDPRQCEYHNPTDGPIDGFTPPLRVCTPSTDGIIEYRAKTFGGQLRGDLLVTRYESTFSRAQLSADGRAITTYTAPFPLFGPLDVCMGPDGTIYGVRYSAGDVRSMAPKETAPASGPRALMLWPQRGPASAARTAKLTGYRLGLGPLPQVKLGGLALAVSAADSFTATVTVPAGFTQGWKDLVVTTSEGSDTLTRAWYAIVPKLTDGDRLPPVVEVTPPEKRYFDRATPQLAVRFHDRLGIDSLWVTYDNSAPILLLANSTDTLFTTTLTVPQALWSAAAPGAHHVLLRGTDDAHNVNSYGWTWLRTLPATGFVRVNCGGPRVTDSAGKVFAADSAYAGGLPISTTTTVAQTSDVTLYQSARSTALGQPLDYPLALPNRAYAVRLHFAEIDTAYARAGARVIDVQAEGDTLVAALDPSSGGAFTAVDRDGEALVLDGQLDLRVSARKGGSLLNALEVYPLGLDDVTNPTIQAIPEPQGVTYDNPPSVTLVANDPNDGELFSILYSIDGGPLRTGVRQLRRPSLSMRWPLPTAAFTALAPGAHTLQLHAADLAGHVTSTAPWSFTVSGLVSVGPDAAPVQRGLSVWPNPARSASLHVRFVQPRSGVAALEVFDLAGRAVVRRTLGWRPAGTSESALELDGASFAPGLYFVRVHAPGLDRTERVVRLP